MHVAPEQAAIRTGSEVRLGLRMEVRGVRFTLPALSVLDVLAVLAPLLQFLQFNIVGRLYLTDVLLAGALPFLVVRFGRRLTGRLPAVTIGFAILWLLAQILTDLVRGSAFRDYARGWAMIFLFLINFCALYLLIGGRPKRLILFAVGAALGGLISYLLVPDALAVTYPWKFGYGSSVTWLLVLLAVWLTQSRRSARMWPAAVFLLAAFLNVVMGFRSTGGVAFLVCCYLLAHVRRRRRPGSTRIRLRQLAVLGAVTFTGAWGAVELYQHAAQMGWLGTAALQKYQIETAGDYGLLLGGRSEILISGHAIIDSPLLGHGSWAKDCSYTSLYLELRKRAGYSEGEEREDCLIPTHSYLMGSWVQAGVLGAVFWVWALSLAVRVLIRLYSLRERLTPMVIFFAFQMIWDVLFSPFGGASRFLAPFYVVVVMSYLSGGTSQRTGPRSVGLRDTILARE